MLWLMTSCKYTPSEPAVTPPPLMRGGFLRARQEIWLQGRPVPTSSPPDVSLCNLLAAAAGREFVSRDGALGQGFPSKMKERELEGAMDVGLPQRDRACRLLLCIAGTRSEKQQVAWHMHALFLVLISRSFMGNLL